MAEQVDAAIETAGRRSWHTLSTAEAASRLEVGEQGLSDAEASRRLEIYGPNEIEQEQETPAWRILVHQFNDPLIYILLAAAVVTFALRDFADTGVILAVAVLNAAIGFVQERRAQQAINCRSLDRSVFVIPPLSNPFLFASVTAALIAHVAVLHVAPLRAVFQTVPLPLTEWLLIVVVSTLIIAGGEIDKWWNRRLARPLG